MTGFFPLIRSAISRPEVAPDASPICPCPNAWNTSAHPLAAPMHGRLSGVDGRCPIQTFTFSAGKSRGSPGYVRSA